MSVIEIDSTLEKQQRVVAARPRIKQPKIQDHIYEFVPNYHRNTCSQSLSKRRLRIRQGVRDMLPPDLRKCLSPAAARKTAKVNKWQTLRHNGPLFAAPYERLPPCVHFYYDNCPMELSARAEEAASYYAKLLGTAMVQQPRFNENFFWDFQRQMSIAEREQIKHFSRCNFEDMHQYLLVAQAQQRQQQRLELAAAMQQHGYCWIDGQRRRVKHFRLESPGLFTTRNGSTDINYSCMGMLKLRVQPEDVIINCGENEAVPVPPAGHAWKQVQHDRSVSWLCCWYDLTTSGLKYIYPERQDAVASVSRADFEMARRLRPRLPAIRQQYRQQWRCENWRKRQLAVALYCIDRLNMGTEHTEQASTANNVDLCQLRVEQLTLRARLDQRKNILLIKWLHVNKKYQLDPEIFYSLRTFISDKQPHELVFEELTPALLQAQLHSLMDGLTPQIFRICNASCMLQRRLKQLAGTEDELLVSYNHILKQLLCSCCHAKPNYKTVSLSLLKRAAGQEQSSRLQILKNNSAELVKASLNYMDPRITVAWCLKQQISLNCIYSTSTLRRRIGAGITERFRF